AAASGAGGAAARRRAPGPHPPGPRRRERIDRLELPPIEVEEKPAGSLEHQKEIVDAAHLADVTGDQLPVLPSAGARDGASADQRPVDAADSELQLATGVGRSDAGLER